MICSLYYYLLSVLLCSCGLREGTLTPLDSGLTFWPSKTESRLCLTFPALAAEISSCCLFTTALFQPWFSQVNLSRCPEALEVSLHWVGREIQNSSLEMQSKRYKLTFTREKRRGKWEGTRILLRGHAATSLPGSLPGILNSKPRFCQALVALGIILECDIGAELLGTAPRDRAASIHQNKLPGETGWLRQLFREPGVGWNLLL